MKNKLREDHLFLEWVYIVPIASEDREVKDAKKWSVFLLIFGDGSRISKNDVLAVLWDKKNKQFDYYLPPLHRKRVDDTRKSRFNEEQYFAGLLSNIRNLRKSLADQSKHPSSRKCEQLRRELTSLRVHYAVSKIQSESRNKMNLSIKQAGPHRRPSIVDTTILDIEMAIEEGRGFWTKESKDGLRRGLIEKYIPQNHILSNIFKKKRIFNVRELFWIDPLPILFPMNLVNLLSCSLQLHSGFDLLSAVRSFLRFIGVHPTRSGGSVKRYRIGQDSVQRIVNCLRERYQNKKVTREDISAYFKEFDLKVPSPHINEKIRTAVNSRP